MDVRILLQGPSPTFMNMRHGPTFLMMLLVRIFIRHEAFDRVFFDIRPPPPVRTLSREAIVRPFPSVMYRLSLVGPVGLSFT